MLDDGTSPPQVEELVGARNPHAGHDLLLLLHRLPGPNRADGYREYNLFHLKKACLFYFILFSAVENEQVQC